MLRKDSQLLLIPGGSREETERTRELLAREGFRVEVVQVGAIDPRHDPVLLDEQQRIHCGETEIKAAAGII